jgi:hypothetical protein
MLLLLILLLLWLHFCSNDDFTLFALNVFFLLQIVARNLSDDEPPGKVPRTALFSNSNGVLFPLTRICSFNRNISLFHIIANVLTFVSACIKFVLSIL